jgi:hypothetical protein
MRILTPENNALNIDHISDNSDEDIRYSVLDLNDPKNYDFYFMPLVYLESFNAPALVLEIDGNLIKVPCVENPHEWKILVGDSSIGEVEAISVEDLNSTNDYFTALSFNPLSSFTFSYKKIKIVDVFNEVRWYMPTLPPNYVLTVPINTGSKPDCIFLTHGATSRRIDTISVGEIF